MSHIANPYKRSSQTLDAGQESLCAGLRRRGCRRKAGLREQAAFCCLPSPALRLYAQNLQYIQAVYPHRRCIEHKAHCQGISSFLFSPVLLRGCFLMEAAPLSSFYGPRKGLLCMFTRMAVFTVPLRRWPRAGAAPWRLRRPLPSAHRLQWQCPRPAPLPC